MPILVLLAPILPAFPDQSTQLNKFINKRGFQFYLIVAYCKIWVWLIQMTCYSVNPNKGPNTWLNIRKKRTLFPQTTTTGSTAPNLIASAIHPSNDSNDLCDPTEKTSII